MKATHKVYWPGQTTLACDDHTKKLLNLGAFLGFGVDADPVTEGECDNCINEAKKG